MKNWQKFLIILLGIVITTTVFAAPISNIFRNIQPETNLTYEIGTSTARWFNVYTRLASTSVVSITNSLYIGGTASTTGTATTTIMGANATSTFSGGIRLSQGCFELANGTCITGGITSLNGLTGATQTFTNDTNVTIVSGGTAHVITWNGTLADSRVADDITLTNITQITNRAFTDITGGTAGSIIFSNGTALTQNNANLFWNNTLNRFGVSSTTPAESLSIQGNALVSGTTTANILKATSTLISPFGINATASSTGSIAIDTSDDQLIFNTGSSTATGTIRVLSPMYEMSFAIASSTTFTSNDVELEKLLLRRMHDNITIREIHCITDAGTQVIAIYQTTQTGGITNLATNGIDGTSVITCDSDGARDDGELPNGNVPAGAWLALNFGTAATSPKKLNITIYYTIQRD